MKRKIKKFIVSIFILSIVMGGNIPPFSITNNVRAEEIDEHAEAIDEEEIEGQAEVIDEEEIEGQAEVIEEEEVEEQVKAKEIRFDLNKELSVLHIIVDGEDCIFFEEQSHKETSLVEDGEVTERIEKDGYTVFTLDNLDERERVIVEAYDVWGYPINITAYDSEGKVTQLEAYENNDRFKVVPLDGSIGRILAGEETGASFSLGEKERAYLRTGKIIPLCINLTKTMVTSGDNMNASNNAVLAFAKNVGFDVDSYLSSPYAWKVVKSDPDGLYDTSEGKSMISGGLTYGIGTIQNAMGNSGLINKGDIWKAMRDHAAVYANINSWNDYRDYIVNNSYETEEVGGQFLSPGSVECAGLVNTFFGYIHENLWDDEDWKLYYQAYNYGIMNSSFGYDTGAMGYNLNNVITVNSGVQGLLNYDPSKSEDYYVKTASTKLSHDEWVDALDKMAPGSIVLFKPDLSSNLIQHAGLYIGKANGLHWMFHTNNTNYRARIIPIEYYSLNFNTGEGDSHKGTLIYRAGGRVLVKDGELKLTKKSKNKDVSNNNSCFDMKGIKYNIFTEVSGAGDNLKPVESSKLSDKYLEITSYNKETSQGTSNTVVLEEGTYYLQEDKASVDGSGYRYHDKVIKVEIVAEDLKEVEVEDEPAINPIGLLIKKNAVRNGKTLSSSDIPELGGAQFEVKYYDGVYTTAAKAEGKNPKKTWTFKTKYDEKEKIGIIDFDKSYKVSGPDLYTIGNLSGVPIGTLIIKETKAPDGYLTDNRIYIAIYDEDESEGKGNWNIYDGKTGNLISETKEKAGNISVDLNLSFNEEVISGDLNFSKVDIDGGKMANIPFLIERLNDDGDVVEYHVVVSDENGKVDTSKLPKTGGKVNSLDRYVDNGVFTDDSKLDSTVGVWFGEDQSNRKSGTGSLIYGQYRIRELQCEANKGQDMLSQLVFKNDLSDFVNGVNKTIENLFIDLIVHPESRFIDESSGSKILTLGGSSDVTDEFRWDHLKVGQKYKLKTEVVYEDREGNLKRIGEGESCFVPKKVDGTSTSYGVQNNTITIKTDNLNGGFLHAIDYLYAVKNSEEILIAEHNTDLNIDSQKIIIPYFKTIASDSETGSKVGKVGTESRIKDIIQYENFPEGRTFLIEGTLMEKESGKELSTPVTIKALVSKKVEEASIKPDGTYLIPISGEIIMPEFIVDTSLYKNKTIVVTEKIYDFETDELFLSHEDLADKNQSVHYMDLKTEATDISTGSKTAVVGLTTIVDEVTLYNVVEGEEYIVKGDLVYKEDCIDSNGDKHKKGDIISSHPGVSVVADVPTGESMTVYLEYEVDSSMMEGISGVVFESVWHQGVEVAMHHDYESLPQTPNWPKVITKAWDKDKKSNYVEGPGENVVIVDTVFLNNLTVGDRYKVRGTLYNKDGTPFLVNGKEVIEESSVFNATSVDMDMDIKFNLKKDDVLEKTIVVYEKLIHVQENSIEGEDGDVTETVETEVAKHEDLTDEEQTVTYKKERKHNPRIETLAYDKADKDKYLEAAGKQIIVDRVMYEDIKPGETYRQILTVYDKETREPIRTKYLKLPVKASVWFTPETPDGYVEVEVQVDGELIQGKTLVMFEEITLKGKTVATHFDFDSESQTVYVREPKRTPDKPKESAKTGDDNPIEKLILVFFVGILSMVFVARKDLKK